MHSEETDDALISRAREGDDTAFDALMTRYSGRVFRLATRVAGNPDDAEEILQDTFLQVHRKLDSFRGDARFSTWLYRIATNAALMFLRKNQRHRAEPLEDHMGRVDAESRPGGGQAPDRADDLAERNEIMLHALEAISALPEIYRMTFVLRDLEGLSTDETAEVLEIEPGAVRQRLHRARLMVREKMQGALGGVA